MRRLRPAFALLVAAPALAFALIGTGVVIRSRAALEPGLDRDGARRALEYVRWHRSQQLAELSAAAEELGARVVSLGIERYAVYDSAGNVTERYPGDAPPLPLAPRSVPFEAMLAAARRGHAVVDLVTYGDEPAWLAYLPRDGHIAVVQRRLDPSLVDEFEAATGYALAIYQGGRRALASAPGFEPELHAALIDSLVSLDRALSTGDGRTAAVPLKDFDDWDAIGALVVAATPDVPATPPVPWLPIAALWLSATFTLLILWRITLRRPGSGLTAGTRRAFAVALLPPALAAAWLAGADSRLAARATDATLELGARTLSLIPRAGHLPPDRAAEIAGGQVVIVRADGVVASDPELVAAPDRATAGPTGRLRVAGQRLAYRVVTAGGPPLLVLTAPLEDARKTVLFWLAGIYGALAAAILIYSSLAGSAGNALELHEARTAWTFLSPSLVLLLVFSAAPLLFAFYLSFHRWNLLEPAKPLVGLEHYVRLAGDGLFWNAALNTAVYSLYVPATMVCALAVAILLNRRVRGVALLRAVFFLPYITSFVAISIVWQWMYDPDFGLLNWLLGLVGLGPFPWLNSPATALPALMILAVWIHIGFQMIIFLAGLQAIPSELYEAAMIDGAGPWRRFWRITLPLLRPTTFFVLVTSIIGSFQVFTFVYVMTEGGPLHATDVIVYHIYQNAWQFLRMGYASAMSWILFAVIFAITLLQFRFLGRRMVPS